MTSLCVDQYQEAVQAICKQVDVLVKKCGKPKMLDAIKLPPSELYKHVEVNLLWASSIALELYLMFTAIIPEPGIHLFISCDKSFDEFESSF